MADRLEQWDPRCSLTASHKSWTFFRPLLLPVQTPSLLPTKQVWRVGLRTTVSQSKGRETHGAKTEIVISKTYTLINRTCYNKGKREKERYTHLNAEFQRKEMRDKKAFLSDQGKEIEENNKMEKTRALFKKIRATKAIFHETIGTIKDRSGMDLTEAEDIKKR